MNSHLGIWWITAKLSRSWPPRICFKGPFRTFNSCRMLKQMYLNCWHSLVNKIGSLITGIRKYIDLLFFKWRQFSIVFEPKSLVYLTKFQFWNFKEGQYLRVSSLRNYVLWSCWRLCCWWIVLYVYIHCLHTVHILHYRMSERWIWRWSQQLTLSERTANNR